MPRPSLPGLLGTLDVEQGSGDRHLKNWAPCAMEFLSSLSQSIIIPQGSYKLLKIYIRAKKLDNPDHKKVVRHGLLYSLFIKGLVARSTPAGG